jgi:hypothetical protein
MQKQNKIFILPLFWKFAIISTIVVIIFGSINMYLLWSSVYKSFEKEIDKRCNVLAKIISEKALTPMVYEDNLSLFKILEEIKQSDPSISYIFIVNNSNKIVAQTYNIKIPKKLINANSLQAKNYNIKVIKANNFEHNIIRDIAYPILNVGTVRLGIAEVHIQEEMMEATRKLLIMIIACNELAFISFLGILILYVWATILLELFTIKIYEILGSLCFISSRILKRLKLSS